MSYSLVQFPDYYNLATTIKDIILDSTEDLEILITTVGTTVIEEIYTPDSDGKVYVRNLGDLLLAYLSGSGYDSETQEDINALFQVTINDVASGTFRVLYCTSNTDVSVSNFFTGNVFLHLLTPVKWITPDSVEYKTVFLTSTNNHEVKVFLTLWNGTDYTNTDPVTLISSVNDTIKKFDASFAAVMEKFPAIDKNTVVAYRLLLPKEIAVYMIDREFYLLPLQFRFLNSFNVPETLVTRGEVLRKNASTFETTKIGNVETKYDIKRKDEFTVSSGKIFSKDDYLRFTEMFNSDNVELFFSGKWRKIIVTEESTQQSLRINSLNTKAFKFTFAEKQDNNIILGDSLIRWMLNNGTWIDPDMWVDAGRWNDTPS